MGGCAPYASLSGMFTSSTNKMYFLPADGPKMPFLRFSHFASSKSWTWFAEVCALNVRQIGTYFRGLKPPCKWRLTLTCAAHLRQIASTASRGPRRPRRGPNGLEFDKETILSWRRVVAVT